MQIESAHISLVGDRSNNQDRVAVQITAHSALAAVVDGMGGHAMGEEAAAAVIETLLFHYDAEQKPVPKVDAFLRRAMLAGHQAAVVLGTEMPVREMPRATAAVCLVQGAVAHWAHLGDSRVYHLRSSTVSERTRDHTHVEHLLQEGLIREDEISEHPLRNFVDSCLGGELEDPPFTLAGAREVRSGDILLVCSDGFWGGLTEAEICGLFNAAETCGLQAGLEELAEAAVAGSAPNSDNTTAAALRCLSA